MRELEEAPIVFTEDGEIFLDREELYEYRNLKIRMIQEEIQDG